VKFAAHFYCLLPTDYSEKGPPAQSSVQNNHVGCLALIDFFAVPTVTFRLLFAFVVLTSAGRRVVHCGVTAHPRAPWVAHQLRAAFPFDQAPRYFIRARDGIYGEQVRRCLQGWASRKS
jgi:hypothetical protein